MAERIGEQQPAILQPVNRRSDARPTGNRTLAQPAIGRSPNRQSDDATGPFARYTRTAYKSAQADLTREQIEALQRLMKDIKNG